mgnify:CR=1 FL=1
MEKLSLQLLKLVGVKDILNFEKIKTFQNFYLGFVNRVKFIIYFFDQTSKKNI